MPTVRLRFLVALGLAAVVAVVLVVLVLLGVFAGGGSSVRITVTSPVRGAIYVQGRLVSASFSCAARAHVAASCTATQQAACPGMLEGCAPALARGSGPLYDHERLNTTTPGQHTVKVTAATATEKLASVTVDYVVEPNAATRTALVLGAVRKSATQLREGRGASLTFSFMANRSGVATAQFRWTFTGRNAQDGRCVAQTPANAGLGACIVSKDSGDETIRVVAGNNALRFSGVIDGHRLGPGTYNVYLAPKSAVPGVQRFTFTIVRAPHAPTVAAAWIPVRFGSAARGDYTFYVTVRCGGGANAVNIGISSEPFSARAACGDKAKPLPVGPAKPGRSYIATAQAVRTVRGRKYQQLGRLTRDRVYMPAASSTAWKGCASSCRLPAEH